mgnify:FL=1|jgi:hypothetical protein
MYIENVVPGSASPNINELLTLVDEGQAQMIVDDFNHREFVWNGKHYFLGRQSRSKRYGCEGGWFNYKVQDAAVRQPTA